MFVSNQELGRAVCNQYLTAVIVVLGMESNIVAHLHVRGEEVYVKEILFAVLWY
jgi:hypothetical protein